MASILVIADDLTGAAELGGVALRYGLSVVISHAYINESEVDVQVINTNTRSLSATEVSTRIRYLFAQIDSTVFDGVYLKFDSALRGHIYQEISLYTSLFNAVSVCFCPVNPVLGRIIRDGKYWVGEQLISQTSFAYDPEFPILKDSVLEILGAPDWKLQQVEPLDSMTGVYVFQAENMAEIKQLARWSKKSSVFAGAAAYFDALLREQFSAGRKSGDLSVIGSTTEVVSAKVTVDLREPILYVCGSTHANSREWLMQQPDPYLVWWDALDFSADEYVIAVLKEKSKAIFAFAEHVDADAYTLRIGMAEMMKRIFKKYEIKELCIEGGATAFEILKELEIDTFTPVQELSSGVIRSKVKNKDLYITLKPGSYQWSTSLCIFNTVLNQSTNE